MAVEAAKDDGITLIALGICPGANSTVRSLASSPELGLILPDYDREVMKEELISIICNSPSGWWFRNFWLPYPGSPCVGTDISDIYLIPHKILFSLHMIKIHHNRNINDRQSNHNNGWGNRESSGDERLLVTPVVSPKSHHTNALNLEPKGSWKPYVICGPRVCYTKTIACYYMVPCCNWAASTQTLKM